mmetsp:Transcript_2465/g.9725  ORF Transcript_2465/g.9725 Transcript_2465/m.9725 type:complete len:223 (+) Transcript_2465:69-737(+)
MPASGSPAASVNSTASRLCMCPAGTELTAAMALPNRLGRATWMRTPGASSHSALAASHCRLNMATLSRNGTLKGATWSSPCSISGPRTFAATAHTDSGPMGRREWRECSSSSRAAISPRSSGQNGVGSSSAAAPDPGHHPRGAAKACARVSVATRTMALSWGFGRGWGAVASCSSKSSSTSACRLRAAHAAYRTANAPWGLALPRNAWFCTRSRVSTLSRKK